MLQISIFKFTQFFNTRKVRLISSAGLLMLISFAGCKNKDSETESLVGDWVTRSTFEGVARSNAAAFTINNRGYVGTGFDGTDRLKDFWEYNPDLNFWQQKADFPGAARNEAVGFGANGKGYMGTGYDGSRYFKDFYAYDPASNTWDTIADFGGTARYGTVAFSLYDKGYVGTGFDGNNKKDFFKYDPYTNTWTQIISPGGDKRIDAVSFVINDKGYICSGLNNGLYVNDLWEYDPVNEVWNQKSDLAVDEDGNGSNERDLRRYGACGFSINGKGYLTCGYYGTLVNTNWEYNPADNTWKQRVNFEGAGRMDAVGLTIGNRGFVLGGKNGNSRYDDLWEFLP